MRKPTPEQRLERMLRDARVPKNSLYRPGQVQKLLNVSDPTFRRMCDEWEPTWKPGRKKRRLECFILLDSHRRVEHQALINFIEEAHGYNKLAGES